MAIESIHIKIDGADIPDDLKKAVTEIRVSESLDRLDEMEARFLLPEVFKKNLVEWHGSEFVAVVQMDDKTRVVSGDLLEVALDRVRDGTYLILRGIDTLHRLKNVRASKNHEGTHSDVAEAIATLSKLGSDVEGTEGSSGEYVQMNETNATFIKRIAEANNYTVRVDEQKLRFVRKDSAGDGASVTVDWNEVASIRLRHSLEGIVTGVKVIGHDPLKDEKVEGESQSSDARKISGGKTGIDIVQEKFGENVLGIDNSMVTQTSTAQAMAKGELQRRADAFVTGTLVCGLQPEARSGGDITIEGAPWPMSGSFVVKEVTHRLSDGAYSTEIEFYSDSLPS